jgi:hypothetical protein
MRLKTASELVGQQRPYAFVSFAFLKLFSLSLACQKFRY